MEWRTQALSSMQASMQATMHAVRWRKKDVGLGQAFKNDSQLQQFLLSDVTPTGRILGTGFYGSVEEVSYKHLVCAGKKLHEALIDVENEGVAEVVRKYLQECQLMSSLRHPNITQFLGLCFLPGTQLPLLVMERLETSLDDLLEHMPNLPLSLKRSILEDVARGLLYLHDRQPPVIHRDLTSKNILLTSSLVAKITDMGNSRIVSMRPGQLARTLTKYPGTLVYMPPEAQDDTHHYEATTDVFSFGHLALYILTQKFPGELLPSTYNTTSDIKTRSEVERREVYIEHLESLTVRDHPGLVEMVKQCLHNDPRERPSTEQLLTRLQGMRGQVEGEYGGPIKLDTVRLRLAKEAREKDRKLEELTQQQAKQEAELAEVKRMLEETKRQLEKLQGEGRDKDAQLVQLKSEKTTKDEKNRQSKKHAEELQVKSAQIQQLRNEVATKEELRCQSERRVEELQAEVQDKQVQIAAKDQQISDKDRMIAKKDSDLSTQKAQLAVQAPELTRLREALGEGPKKSEQEPLKLPLQLTWKRGPDIPFEMSDCAQSVVIQGRLYIGGGYAGPKSDKNYLIMEYNISSGEWTTLPPYRAHAFAMAVISNQLVLVGGWERDNSGSKVLGVWRADRKEWTHPYPDMPTARSYCSAVVWNEWLVVAGGQGGKERVACVEILHTGIKQWYAGPPTPSPWSDMRTAVVGNESFFMGGVESTGRATEKVHYVNMGTLVSSAHITPQATSKGDREIWKEISEHQLKWSTPLSVGSSLLAVGGMDKKFEAVTAIHLYQPDSKKWVKVGDLPSPRYTCTCAVTSDRKVLVAGGNDGSQHLKRMDFSQL